MGGEILSVAGFAMFLIGVFTRPKENYFLHLWLFSLFAYFAIFATGNVRHNYYQLIFVPVASIFVAKGIYFLMSGSSVLIPRIWTIIAVLMLVPLMFYFSWKEVSGFYQINNPNMVEAGRVADKVLPKNAVVVAPYNGDTAFLYQTNRPGWPVTALPLSEMVSKYGVTHYVSTIRDAKTEWVTRHFEVLVDNQKYVIADLTNLKKRFDPKDTEP